MSAEVTLSIISMLLKHGPSAVATIAPLINGEKELTKEDIESLFITKSPEDYFNDR